jgi:hypothetical protein
MITITATAPTATKLARVANALADQFVRGLFTVGAESLSALALGLDLVTWSPRVGVVVLQLCLVNVDGTTGPVLRTVTVCPGQARAFDIIEGDGLLIGETRGVAAAFSIAIERLAEPVMRLHQDTPDPVAV